jgi:hypothetical protein
MTPDLSLAGGRRPGRGRSLSDAQGIGTAAWWQANTSAPGALVRGPSRPRRLECLLRRRGGIGSCGVTSARVARMFAEARAGQHVILRSGATKNLADQRKEARSFAQFTLRSGGAGRRAKDDGGRQPRVWLRPKAALGIAGCRPGTPPCSIRGQQDSGHRRNRAGRLSRSFAFLCITVALPSHHPLPCRQIRMQEERVHVPLFLLTAGCSPVQCRFDG